MKNCRCNGLCIIIFVYVFFTLQDDLFLQKPKHVAVKQYKHSCDSRSLFPVCKLCVVATAGHVQIRPSLQCGELPEV